MVRLLNTLKEIVPGGGGGGGGRGAHSYIRYIDMCRPIG